MIWVIIIAGAIPYIENPFCRGDGGYLLAISLVISAVLYLTMDKRLAWSMLRQSYYGLTKSPAFLLYYCFMLLSFFILLFFYKEPVTISQFVRLLGYIVIGFLAYIVIPILVWPDKLQKLSSALMYFGTFCALLGLLSIFANINSLLGFRLVKYLWSPVLNIPAIAGPFYEINAYATVLAFGILSSVYLIRKRHYPLVAYICFAVTSTSLFFTWSRAMFLGIPLALLGSFFVTVDKIKQKKMFYAGLFLSTLVVAAIYTIPPLYHLLEVQKGLTGREDLWVSAIDAVLDRPLSGYGMGKESIYYAMINIGGRDYSGVVSSHNGFLEMGIQAGLFTALLYLLVFLISFFRLLRSWINKLEKAAIASGMLISFVAVSFYPHSLGGVSYTSFMLGIFWGIGNYAYLKNYDGYDMISSAKET